MDRPNMYRSTIYRSKFLAVLIGAIVLCSYAALAQVPTDRLIGVGIDPVLPLPDAGRSAVKMSRGVGWKEGETPYAPDGFVVRKFADNLNSPRWVYVLPNGDVLVAEAKTGRGSANRITRLRDNDGDGIADERSEFLTGLNRPFGMVLVGNYFYVANTDSVMRYPYKEGDTAITAAGKKIMDLPAGGYNNHWTRNIVANKGGTTLYISVGSASNIGEHGMAEEDRRANILTAGLDGTNERIFAAGLRNPVGMAWEPVTGALWTVVNERDGMGDDLVPDYLTRVQENGFYGWPYSYFGRNQDPRLRGERPDLVASALVPDYALGGHTASLGLAFYTGDSFPDTYKGGAFIGQRGSWNRSVFSGYRVIYVPFRDGRPDGPPQDFLTGFMKDEETGKTRGRPVGVTVHKDGGLLVADDVGDSVWYVQAAPD